MVQGALDAVGGYNTDVVFFGDDTDFAMLTSSVPTGHSANGQERLASMAGLWVVGALALKAWSGTDAARR